MNPLSTIFGAGVALRNRLYERGAFKTRKLARPVVSAGSLSAGGSGKTPFVIALGKLLKERGIEFDVLSRGYGRASRSVAVVDAAGSAEEFGDESLLIARTLHVPVIVASDRYHAGTLAEKRFSSRLHLLDDGFQHRKLHRDFDIVLLPERDRQDTLLPVGRLREPLSALRRADAVVVEPQAPPPPQAVSVWSVSRKVTVPSSATRPNTKVVAFCGIAHPRQFFDSLKAAGANVVATVTFRDHHPYSQSDVDRLMQARARAAADCLLTTEKDAVKLAAFPAALQPLEIAVFKLHIENSSVVMEELLGKLEQRTGCRF